MSLIFRTMAFIYENREKYYRTLECLRFNYLLYLPNYKIIRTTNWLGQTLMEFDVKYSKISNVLVQEYLDSTTYVIHMKFL
jgi:hypothetical protein